AGDLDDLGHALVARLALVGRVRDGPRDHVVLLAVHDEQRAPLRVLRVDLRLGPRVEVGGGGLEEGLPGGRYREGRVQLFGLVLADGVGEGVAELLVRERYRAM